MQSFNPRIDAYHSDGQPQEVMDRIARDWAQVGVVMPDALLDPSATTAQKASATTRWARELTDWFIENEPKSLAASITRGQRSRRRNAA